MTCICGHEEAQHRAEPDPDDPRMCAGRGPLGLGGCACAGYTTEPRCDFCSRTPAPWTFPCRSAAMKPPPGLGIRVHISVSDWAACEECYDCITTDDRYALAERMVLDPRLTEREVLIVRANLRRMHALQFFAARTGQPYRHADQEGKP